MRKLRVREVTLKVNRLDQTVTGLGLEWTLLSFSWQLAFSTFLPLTPSWHLQWGPAHVHEPSCIQASHFPEFFLTQGLFLRSHVHQPLWPVSVSEDSHHFSLVYFLFFPLSSWYRAPVPSMPLFPPSQHPRCSLTSLLRFNSRISLVTRFFLLCPQLYLLVVFNLFGNNPTDKIRWREPHNYAGWCPRNSGSHRAPHTANSSTRWEPVRNVSSQTHSANRIRAAIAFLTIWNGS